MTQIKAAAVKGRQCPAMHLRLCQILTVLLLASSLTLSGLASAAAGVGMTAAGAVARKVVICSDAGPATIAVDDQGNPVKDDPQHDCASCAFCLSHGSAALAPCEVHLTVPASLRNLVVPARRSLLLVRTLSSHPARAPPQKV